MGWCIRHDGTVLEHEHADHPDYLFPVRVEYIGPLEEVQEDLDRGFDVTKESHALIFTDGTIAVTMYKYCYAIWYLRAEGKLMYGDLWDPPQVGRSRWTLENSQWRITAESLEDIKTYHKDGIKPSSDPPPDLVEAMKKL